MSATKAIIEKLAAKHGIKATKNSNNAIADDEIITDETEDLLVSLKAAGVIDEWQMIYLLGDYLEERLKVQADTVNVVSGLINR